MKSHKEIKKILAIQLRQMGDVIMTTPAIRQLRKIFPKAQLDFMTERLGTYVYRFNRNVDNIIEVNRTKNIISIIGLFHKIYRCSYDLVLDFFSNPSSAQITYLSRAAHRVGFDFRFRRYAYTLRVSIPDNVKYAAMAKNLLIHKFGGDVNDFKIEFPIDENYKKFAEGFSNQYKFTDKTVAFCTVSRREYKLWDSEYLAKVANYLISENFKMFFVYGPGERGIAEKVYRLLGNKQNIIFEYKMPDVLELRAIMEKCKFFLGIDGGPKHLAICAGIPTVTLFNNVKAENWTPPNSKQDFFLQLDNDDSIYENTISLLNKII